MLEVGRAFALSLAVPVAWHFLQKYRLQDSVLGGLGGLRNNGKTWKLLSRCLGFRVQGQGDSDLVSR